MGRYAKMQVKEREHKEAAALEQKQNADLTKAARQDVANAKKKEAIMDENDAAERKELNKLSESRRRAAWTMPGTNDRRRSSSKREPDKLPEHGGARRRRTRMEDYEADSSMAVPVKVLEQQALKAAPETVLRKEIKSIEGRRRRAAAETAQEAKSSKKVWATLESQINAATSSATNKAAKKAAEAGRKALADLQKATG